jgi:hypothetical protein
MPSKSVGGRKLAGGFDSRPPPLLKEASDQPLREEAGVGRPRRGLDRSSGDRVYHTSLSVFASRGTGQVFRPPAGRPDKSSAAVLSKERREAGWSDALDDPWRGGRFQTRVKSHLVSTGPIRLAHVERMSARIIASVSAALRSPPGTECAYTLSVVDARASLRR